MTVAEVNRRESSPEVVGVIYRSGVYKISMARMVWEKQT